MKKHLFWILILATFVFSCKKNKSENTNGHNMKNEFVSRIHTTELETDLYQLLGKTSLEKHISDFNNVNWKSNYEKEFNSMDFNMPDLEVLSKNDSKYLSVSIAPNTDDTYQFIIGLGTHLETDNPNIPNRKVKLYMTESDNEEVPKKFIELFFKRDFAKINTELDQLYLMDEVEDVYINKK
ncbi:hypothetical protein D2V05_11815 [Flagellimonas pelagia]|uniref:Lipoprotein n=2 Tax=Flagellimonas pelagia TaxID=2306998 RepID=A0A3A1NK74_9FLAO|nr:hypothetical protein D2V05_11815 [Allomuricauda maritima]